METKNNRFTILLLATLILTSTWMLPLANAVVLPEVPGGGTYYSDYGVLDTDTYLLYPWENRIPPALSHLPPIPVLGRKGIVTRKEFQDRFLILIFRHGRTSVP